MEVLFNSPLVKPGFVGWRKQVGEGWEEENDYGLANLSTPENYYKYSNSLGWIG